MFPSFRLSRRLWKSATFPERSDLARLSPRVPPAHSPRVPFGTEQNKICEATAAPAASWDWRCSRWQWCFSILMSTYNNQTSTYMNWRFVEVWMPSVATFQHVWNKNWDAKLCEICLEMWFCFEARVRRFHSAPAPLPYGSDVDVPEPTPGCEFGSSLRSLRFGEESIDGLSYTQIYRGKLEETMVYPV